MSKLVEEAMQKEVDKLQARNEQLVEALGVISVLYDDGVTTSTQALAMYDASCLARQALSNHPTELYRARQAVVDKAIRAEPYLSLLSSSDTLELCLAVANLNNILEKGR